MKISVAPSRLTFFHSRNTDFHRHANFRSDNCKKIHTCSACTVYWAHYLDIHVLEINCDIYLNGNNLWFWSRMPDDRENTDNGGDVSQGAYPPTRRVNFGIDVTF